MQELAEHRKPGGGMREEDVGTAGRKTVELGQEYRLGLESGGVSKSAQDGRLERSREREVIKT